MKETRASLLPQFINDIDDEHHVHILACGGPRSDEFSLSKL
jgi:hypothetical protein